MGFLVSRSQSGSPTTEVDHHDQKAYSKTAKNTSFSALMGFPTAVTLTAKHSLFMKMILCKTFWAQDVFSDHNVTPWPQKVVTFPKNVKNNQDNFTFCSDEGSNSCYIGY